MNILIVKLSAIGDVIHTLPVATALRRHYPDARLAWLVEEGARDLVIGHRALDRVIVSGRKRWIADFQQGRRAGALREARDFIKALRDTRYDLLLDFQASLKSGILIGLARADRKVGFGQGMAHSEHSHLFLNERIPAVSMEVHALDRGLILLNAIGVPAGDTVAYDLPIGAADRQAAATLLAGAGDGAHPLVAVNPVAKWATKLWHADRFAEVADRLVSQHHATVVFTGAPEDRPVVAAIIARMRSAALNIAGRTTLKTLAAVYRQADLVVSTDTGPMHLAAAAGVPVVALFGPTAPWRTGPYGPNHRIVRVPMACSPCFKRRCATTACMGAITVDEVMGAIEEALDQRRNNEKAMGDRRWAMGKAPIAHCP